MSSFGSNESPTGVVEEKKSNKNEEEQEAHVVVLQEFILGIEDRPIASWKKRPPLFEERIRATNQHTFLDVIKELCNTAVRKRRRRFGSDDHDGGDDSDDGSDDDDDDNDDDDDCGIQDHLWEFKIYDPNYKPFDPLLCDDDMDDIDDEMEEREPTGIRIAYELDRDEMNDYRYNVRNISARTMLSERVLPLGHVGKFQYDFSHTTEINLKVLSVRTIIIQGGDKEEEDVNKDSLFGYFVEVGDQTSNERDIFSMPAYHLPEEEQIDAFYPNFARACLGKGVPLYKSSHPGGGGCKTGKLTMGLATKIASEQDTTFCALEDSSNSNDLLFCPDVMNLTALFAACEEAWTPKECHPREDPDALYRYEYGCICRFVLNKDNQQDIERVQKMAAGGWGPKYILKTTSSPSDLPSDKKFDFAGIFPRTAAHLTSGKFRWFTYNRNNVLRVMVGRAGKDRSIKDSRQVLRTWKQKFHSLHELFCAVEASWIDENGEPLEATTFLVDFDGNVGPSRPGPINPPLLATESDAIVLSSPNSKKKLVTALSMAKENNGDLVVYCGHDDGTLAKWNLESGQLLFREQIYADGTNDYGMNNRSSDCFSLCETGGVAGLIVREKKNELDGHHVLYTWTHAHSGYPDVEFKNRTSSTVKAWSGKDGKLIQSYECIVGNDEKGKPAHPSIACVVFCRLLSDNKWQDSLIVGLHCLCPRTLYGTGDYSNFNLDAAQSIGEGNILPFNEHSGERMDTWRGHNGMIQALAIIPDKYLFSYSIQPGHGHADAIILWDLKRPGVPLSRLNLWNPNTTVLKQSLTRIYGVVGISVHGKNVLLACEYGYQVAVISVEDDDDESGGGGAPAVRVCGYASLCPRVDNDVSSFHGCMAMSGHVAAMASNDYRMTWLFNINEMESHAKLDRHDGNKFAYDKNATDSDVEDEDRVDFYAGRHLVRGLVNLPEPTNRIIGGDGPIVLAMRGKYLAAGYANGSIVHVKLPDDFDQENNTCEDGLTSCCWLSSCEWATPALWHDKENKDAWAPFDMGKASRWGNDSDDDDGDDESVSDSEGDY